MKALVIHRHPILQQALGGLVRRTFANAQVQLAVDLAAATRLCRIVSTFEFAILDLLLPECSGVQAVVHFRQLWKSAPLLVVSAIDNYEDILAALDAGALGFVSIASSLEGICAAMRVVAAGERYIPAAISGVGGVLDTTDARPGRATRRINDRLTHRQREILRFVARGYGNKKIAQQLGISESTVKVHLHTIYAVLGVSSRIQAMVAATERGIKL